MKSLEQFFSVYSEQIRANMKDDGFIVPTLFLYVPRRDGVLVSPIHRGLFGQKEALRHSIVKTIEANGASMSLLATEAWVVPLDKLAPIRPDSLAYVDGREERLIVSGESAIESKMWVATVTRKDGGFDGEVLDVSEFRLSPVEPRGRLSHLFVDQAVNIQ